MTGQIQFNIPEEAFDWYDAYAHGMMDRREFMDRLGTLAKGGITMAMLTSALIPNYALAEQVNFNDEDIKASYATFSSPNGHGEGRGYLVQPSSLADGATAPCVLVVHENRGLNPYVKDVARRLAKVGFVAFAPDALHPLGGYPGNDDEGRTMQRSLDRSKIEADFIAAANFLHDHALSSGKVGVVGFCFGGYISNFLAASLPDVIDAAVPYYGTPARNDIVGNVKGPVMIQLAETDERVNAAWPAYEEVLKANNAPYQMHMYPDTRHGFHNDSTGRYNPEMAELSWGRTIEFFNEHLN
ncbi:dienelactone hydrolase family protein [Pseudemcibacter aquimaris]|uniref:dienelactone hydrolase family protein n=1 Tax=Pseudemcibacter aquimaris TaxID=2857064 RepID=UPI00201380EF|nr:dienelactone hydrolase family protein [Pseudemcibacter aquimaris]MCC3860240.1 dienelactone hydrolase family protein [Pseudemcibacter aquimaris]WDU57565.1 dienelactone hydrolase family protein [Pseudemcibacter aquimaris]